MLGIKFNFYRRYLFSKNLINNSKLQRMYPNFHLNNLNEYLRHKPLMKHFSSQNEYNLYEIYLTFFPRKLIAFFSLKKKRDYKTEQFCAFILEICIFFSTKKISLPIRRKFLCNKFLSKRKIVEWANSKDFFTISLCSIRVFNTQCYASYSSSFIQKYRFILFVFFTRKI